MKGRMLNFKCFYLQLISKDMQQEAREAIIKYLFKAMTDVS